MKRYLDINAIKERLIKRFRMNRLNNTFIFEIEKGRYGDSFTITLNSDVYICFDEFSIKFQLDKVDIIILYQQGLSMWSDMDLDDRILADINPEIITTSELIDYIYELCVCFAGVTDSYMVKRDLYKSHSGHCYYNYDVYISNCFSVPVTKVLANMTFCINTGIKDEYKNDRINLVNANERRDLLNVLDFNTGFNYIMDLYANENDRFYAKRFIHVEYIDDDIRIHFFNGIDGDLKYELSKNGVLFHCRGRRLYLKYNIEKNILNNDKGIVELYDRALKNLSAIEFHEEVAKISLILTGAGDISYKERLDNEGNLTGYDIYVEKEYDESYTREYDNVTFHVNDGYVHKTEQERLADYLADNKDMIITVQDIVKLIMHPLQVTKASRFLCYRLEEQETATPIIYFNGNEGDFYLKAYGDMLVLHCRDMVIIFNANETMLDDAMKSEMCIDEDDFVMFYNAEASNNMVDIFSVVYEMIFILAGAGEVNHEMITAEYEENRYVISLEKEYIKPYSRSFGNISFAVSEETIN